MKYKASIDIGSNSILLLIVDEKINVIESHSRVTGLGKNLDQNQKFLEESMLESKKTFADYFAICTKWEIKPEEVIVTATEASRVAKNAKTFFDNIRNEFGFSVTTITGLGEAYYSTMGVLFDKSIQEPIITIMDIGGASTELIRVDVANQKILHSFSMPMGVVRFNNWTEDGILESKINEIFTKYQADLEQMKASKVYCVAGTMTSIANISLGHSEFIEKEVHGLKLSVSDIDSLKNKFSNWDPERFLKEYPFLGKRAHTIKSGFELAKTVLDKISCQETYISTFGLRYGTILSGGIQDGFIFKA